MWPYRGHFQLYLEWCLYFEHIVRSYHSTIQFACLFVFSETIETLYFIAKESPRLVGPIT
jgi:hypothetical protein